MLAALLLVATLGSAATYESLAELPAEPAMLIEDHKYDLTEFDGGSTAVTGWQDLLEVKVYLTDETLIFVITGNGPMLPPPGGRAVHPQLFVLLDVDGDGGPMGLDDMQDWSAARIRGYDVLIGYYGGNVGLRRVTGSQFGSSLPVMQWREENSLYLEVAWSLLGGYPEMPLGFMVFAEDDPKHPAREITRDQAPNGYPGQIPPGTP
jgi:hypothetical protein